MLMGNSLKAGGSGPVASHATLPSLEAGYQAVKDTADFIGKCRDFRGFRQISKLACQRQLSSELRERASGDVQERNIVFRSPSAISFGNILEPKRRSAAVGPRAQKPLASGMSA